MMRRCMLVAVMLVAAGWGTEGARAQRLFWLGTLGGPESKALGVSNNGVVVGYATNLAGESRAFRWTEASGMQDLGALILYSTHSYAYDVSEDGSVVVGQSHRPFRWTEPSGMQPIDTDHLGVASSVSYDGSLSGGWFFDGATGRDRPFRWTESSGMDILFEDAGHAFVRGVSGDGSVCVGSLGDVSPRAFRWTEATGVQDLGTLGGSESVAYAADEDGSVIVGYAVNTSGHRRPFRWTSSAGMTDLTSLGLVSEALDVSASGQKIVGYYVINGTEDERAVQWNLFPVLSIRNLTGHYADLLSAGSVLNRAEAISPDGRYIAGWGFNAETGRTEAFLLDTSVSTAVEDATLPQEAVLAGAYPNPFRLSTTLGFTVSRPGPVRLQVYDALGRLVRSLVDEHRGVGAYQVVWDGRDAAGREVPAGVYLVRFETGGHAQTRTLVVLR